MSLDRLKLHPLSHTVAVAHVKAAIACPRTDHLVFRYAASGNTSQFRIPPLAMPDRGDALWHQTCFEAFVRARTGTEYYEFNFSPSRQWAAYRFANYRSGKRLANEISAVAIEVLCDDDCFFVEAAVRLDGPLALPFASVWRVGLSAVIEEISGEKTFWALAHPPGKPDFHHVDCFTHELSPVVE